MGHITMQERDRVIYKTYNGSSQDLATSVSTKNGPGGWLVGWYFGAPDAITLNQALPWTNFGDPLVMYGAHMVLVAGGLPTTDGDPMTIEISGTALTRTERIPNHTEVLTLENVDLNTMLETEARWLGEVTITLVAPGAANYSFQFNYGFALADEMGGRHFELDLIEIYGTATDDDEEFDLIFYRHTPDNWEFAAIDWDMHGPPIGSLEYILGPETLLAKNQPFGGFKGEIQQFFRGDLHEGLVVRMRTSSSKSIGNISVHLGVIV